MEAEDLKAELTCPICMDLFREPRRLPCGHVYCRVCLQDMLTRKYLNTRACERVLSCPECRQRYDLTFEAAGVDVFPRDFKLVRLVELCQKSFCRHGDDDAGAEAGADHQTAVKEVYVPDTESNTPPTSPPQSSASPSSAAPTPPSASTATLPASSTHPLSRQHLEASLHSFGSPAASLSDDSWIYVTPDNGRAVTRLVAAPRLGGGSGGGYERGDDTWLHPSLVTDTDFPLDAEQDVRGSAALDYRRCDPGVDLSGHYDNQGREHFERYVAAEQVAVGQRSAPTPASPSSESSSGSDTSDERGDEGSDERSGDEVSRSGSEDNSQGQKRRSRLSRFFRSLVMSDSESWDEDDPAYAGAAANHFERPPHFQGDGEEGSVGGVMEERGVEMVPGGVGQDVSHFDHTAVPGPASLPQGQSRSAAVRTEVGVEAGQWWARQDDGNDRNHDSLPEGGAALCRHPAADIAPVSLPVVGATVAVGMPSSRGRTGGDVSEDSDEDYQPQTSMLRPRRKPRSRLKKFFTSLLSLSSSEDEEETEGPGESSIPVTDRH